MKEFSCLLVVSVLGGSEKSIVLCADPFTFEPSMTDENGGVYWDCSKTFIVDIADESILNELKVPRSAIVTLASVGLPNARTYDIGTETIPAKVQLVRHLNKAKLIVKCKMLANPLL
nr:MAG TPA: hypothetical protein [Caudoviricetes sp.]